MSKSKKRILIVSVAVALVALLGLGTLAYFTDSEELSNLFKTTDQTVPPGETPDPDKIFSTELFEHDGDGNETKEGVTYEKVIPGAILDKDPTVRNTGEYDQWVRMIVTIDHAAAWRAILANDNGSIFDIFDGMDLGADKTWTWKEDESKGYKLTDTEEEMTLMFYLNEKLAPGAEKTIFTKVKIPTSATVEQMAALHGEEGFHINAKAESIQADYTADNAIDAFANCWPNP